MACQEEVRTGVPDRMREDIAKDNVKKIVSSVTAFIQLMYRSMRYTRIHIHVHVQLHVHVQVHVHAHKHIQNPYTCRMHADTKVYTYAYRHTHIQLLVQGLGI